VNDRSPSNLYTLPDEVPRLLACCFFTTRSLSSVTQTYLPDHRVVLLQPQSQSDLLRILEQESQRLDCLILQESPALLGLISWLNDHAILLPTIIVQSGDLDTPPPPEPPPNAEIVSLYHTAEIRLPLAEFAQIESALEAAIAQFLYLSPSCRLPSPNSTPDLITDLSAQNFLLLQQRRLSDKLKERLGYMGVYYKRHPSFFLRNLTKPDQEELLHDLKIRYRSIVLSYFSDDGDLNQKIDSYVDTAFFADIPVSQAVEIHMEIMDDFAKQLKLEGRNEEVVLDYRLTLIDTLANLCEMYRRSIPQDKPDLL
jgi:circadian clock protein KaiA